MSKLIEAEKNKKGGKKMKKTVFKIICIVIAIACLGAAGFLAYKNGLINTDKLKNAFRKIMKPLFPRYQLAMKQRIL